jgi:large subunit ribosomal protein L35
MPKLKTKQKAAKRFRVTKNGKVIARATGRRHLMGSKDQKLKRHMRRALAIGGQQAKMVKSVLPYA